MEATFLEISLSFTWIYLCLHSTVMDFIGIDIILLDHRFMYLLDTQQGYR